MSLSNYPASLDTNANLFEVHDELRVTLADDYNPGDKRITIYDEFSKMSLFPTTGLITLTEQQSELDKRSITFTYDNTAVKNSTIWAGNTFENLTLQSYCKDVVKPKDITHVTMNVMAEHHNTIKDALIAIENFIGYAGMTPDLKPFGKTLLGRLNFVKKLVLTPRVWFTADKQLGLVPLSVNFQDQSFRLGSSGKVIYTWDFGDGSTSVQTIYLVSGTKAVAPSVTKIYAVPNRYDVTLTVQNQYGSDSTNFQSMINARIQAPDEAVIEIIPQTIQIQTAPDTSGMRGIRSPIGVPIDIRIPVGSAPYFSNVRRPKTSLDEFSYAGELLGTVIYKGGDIGIKGNSPSTKHDNPFIPTITIGNTNSEPITGTPIDPITNYTWSLSDDLTHPNSPNTKALYSVGGLYDLVLRTDTKLGAYRITTHQEIIDIVENTNLWLWNFTTSPSSTEPWALSILGPGSTGTVYPYEFGLLCETFKTAATPFDVVRNDAFLNVYSNLDTQTRAKKEFRRNTGFSQRGTNPSGLKGDCLLFWASGSDGSVPYDQHISMMKYTGFTKDIAYPDNASQSTQLTSDFQRPWNWICLSTFNKSYFLFGSGNPSTAPLNTNPSCQIEQTYDYYSSTPMSTTTWGLSNYLNGANELMQHPSSYDAGIPVDGYFAVYRSTWKNNTGYFLRNSGTGSFFRLSSFYKTEGSFTNPVQSILKLTDMPGIKTEGQLVALASGLFFFNNSGNIAAFNDTTGIWEIGGPSQSSISFMSLQDTSAENFSLQDNTLLATSDGAYAAYLSYDYSPNTFIKFNAQDATFTTLLARPEGSQFMMGVY